MPTRRTTTKRGAKGPRKKPGPKPKPKAPPEPSHTRGHVTARRMGRPRKLNQALIEELVGHLALGLHLHHASALVGVNPDHASVWLRKGRADDNAGTPSIEADLSRRVRQALATVVQQHVGSLSVYTRMAEGWSPTCKACRSTNQPCGAHVKNLKLAADLTRWMLSHRFPREWHTSTVAVELGGDDAGLPLVAGDAGQEGPRTVATALVMYLPQRREDHDG